MDDISDISRLSTKADNVIVIGQSMKGRVIPEAINLGREMAKDFLVNPISDIGLK